MYRSNVKGHEHKVTGIALNPLTERKKQQSDKTAKGS